MKFRCLTLVLCMGFASGCATVVNGTHQTVEIRSTPPGARALILPDDETIATPGVVELDRRLARTIRFELAGYCPEIAMVDRVSSRWVLGNLILGGLIGVFVDMYSPARFRLQPDPVEIGLRTEADGCGPPQATTPTP